MSIAVIVTVISALGAVVAALVAGYYARKTKQAELEAARVLELEKRLAGMKEEVYRPMVELFRSMLDSVKSGKKLNQPSMVATLSKFTSWAQIYGSDEVVMAHHKMMQVAFNDAPGNVLMRFFAEMILALRKDLGDPETKVDVIDLLGMRITDIYRGEWKDTFALDEEAFLAREGWSAPWGDRFKSQT